MTKKKKIIIAVVVVLIAAVAIAAAVVRLKKPSAEQPAEPVKTDLVLKLEAGEYTAAYNLVETEEEKLLVKNENLAAICASITMNKFQFRDVTFDGVWINEDCTYAVSYVNENYFFWSIGGRGRFEYIGSHKGELNDLEAESADSEYDTYHVHGKIVTANNSDYTDRISSVVIDENKISDESLERINALISGGNLSDPNSIPYVGNIGNDNA